MLHLIKSLLYTVFQPTCNPLKSCEICDVTYECLFNIHIVSPPSLSRSSTPQRYSSDAARSEHGSGSDVRLSVCFNSHEVISFTQSQSTKPGGPKRKLQFSGKDVVNLITRRRTTSSSSNDGSEKSPSQPTSRSSPRFFNKKVFQIPKLTKQPKETGVDSRVKTASGHYSVAPRDISVLDRISHKAHNRAHRVRKSHEVSAF